MIHDAIKLSWRTPATNVRGKVVHGHVTRILAAMPNGPPVDEHNPNPGLRGRPVQGIEVLSGFVDKGSDWRGRIYDHESGNSILTREPGGLKAQGCILFFCRTQHWKAAG